MSAEKHDLYEEAGIKQGVVPVHMGFGNFIPAGDDHPLPGTLPRTENKLNALEAIDQLLKISTVKIHVMQIPVFPGTKQSDIDELIEGINERSIEPQLIMMVPAGNPMNTADTDKVA